MTNELDVDLTDRLRDGREFEFRFNMPQFDDQPSMFLACEAYVCDRHLDAKPYCDRTCVRASRARRAAGWGGGGGAVRAVYVGSVREEVRLFQGPFIVTSDEDEDGVARGFVIPTSERLRAKSGTSGVGRRRTSLQRRCSADLAAMHVLHTVFDLISEHTLISGHPPFLFYTFFYFFIFLY